ncbi:MAG: hypothetical protein BZY65_02835 [SAR202 cluster bacterium Ae2-Chloro-G2]|nr:MAG: hypothetical protein BZY65_02835 [SAR202 cluster bacterium Ae2-Chloro-G2]
MTSRELSSTRISVSSWIIYDMGSTLFFSGVVGLVFPLWVTDVMGGDDATVGYTLTASMLVVFFLSPVLGTLSDRFKRRMPFLLTLTIVGVISTLSIGTFQYPLSVALFCFAVSSVYLSGIFYNGLLADIATKDNVGFIGGIGVGMGYFGGILAVILGFMFLEMKGHIFLFRTMAIFMLLLSVPLIITGRYKLDDSSKLPVKKIVLHTFLVTFRAVSRTVENKIWLWFLIARFWYLWAISAASFFAVLYGVNTVNLTEREVQLVLLVGIITGVPMGALWGWVVDRVGPLLILRTNVAMWVFLLGLAAAIPILDLTKELWWMVGLMSGSALAGLYVSERPYVLSIAPKNRLGEYFGVFNMAGRLAAIAGPFSWGFISATLGLGQSAAIVCLTVCALFAFIILTIVKIPGKVA